MQGEYTPRISHGKSTTPSGYLNPPDFREAAEAMSTGISSAMHRLSSFSSFLPQNIGPNVDHGPLKKNYRSPFENMQGYTFEEKKDDSFTEEDNLTVSDGLQPTQNSAFTLHRPIPKPVSEASSSSNRSLSTTPSLRKSTSKDSRPPYETTPPMARMRDSSVHQAAALKEGGRSSTVHKSQEEIKVEKQRKWKRKMKIAQKKKRQERRVLEGDVGADVLSGRGLMDLILSQVHVEKTNFLHLIRDQCGGTMQETSSDSSQDSAEEYIGEESSYAVDAESRSSESYKSLDARKAEKSSSNRRGRKKSRSSVITPPRSRQDPSASKRAPPRPRTSSPLSRTYSERSIDTEVWGSILSPNTVKSALSAGTENCHMSPLPAPHLGPPQLSHSPQGETERHSETSNARSASSESSKTSSATIDPKDKNFVKAFIHDVISQGFPILWHKVQNSMNPSSILLNIKPGYRTPDGSHCGPELVWADSQEEISYGFSLFDIQSLELARPLHVQDYPFAIPGRSVLLRLRHGHDFVFEAKSDQDAWRFVHGMRWVIARLAFNLVVGNLDVSCELLDVGIAKSPKSLFEEAEMAIAMDDVTDQLVAKSVLHV